jgi:hypothetical protein
MSMLLYAPKTHAKGVSNMLFINSLTSMGADMHQTF